MGNACKKAGIQPGVVLSSAHTKRLWEKYDKSNTGHLSRKDARSFLKDYAAALKGQLSDSDANALLDECDPSSKGQLSYEEFKRLCAQSASKIDSNISLTSSMQLCINHTQDATPPSSSGSASSSSSSSSSSSTHTTTTTTTTTTSSSSGSSSSSSATKSPPAKAAPPPSGPTLFFDDYRDLSLSGERMGMDGMQKFASDLGIEADDVFLFVFAWKAKAAKICEFSREEFVRGFEAVGCKSIADLKAKVPTVRAMIDSKDGYRQYYEFFFDYSKEPHTKFMTVQEATVMLPLVLGTRFTQLDRFLVFLENVHKKPIGRDIWKELLPFAEQFKSDPDFATYDSGECWPVVFDKFVDWVQHPPAEGEGEGENATASTS